MKQLIWKELREQRYIPAAYGGLTVASIAMWYAVDAWNAERSRDPLMVLSANAATLVLIAVVCLLGVFAGSGAISQEMGRGTIGFLSTLPTGRARLWRAKVTAGIITMSLALISTLVCYASTVLILYGTAGLKPIVELATGPDYRGWSYLLLLLCGVCGYSVCLFASTLVDRALVAAVLGLTAGTGIILIFGMWAYSTPSTTAPPLILLTLAVIAGLTACFLLASYVAFSSGDPLLPRVGIKRGTVVLVVGMAVISCALLACRAAMWPAYAAFQAREQKLIPLVTFQHSADGDNRYWRDTHIRIAFSRFADRGMRLRLGLVSPLSSAFDVRTADEKLPATDARPYYYEDDLIEPSSKAKVYLGAVSTRDSGAFIKSRMLGPNCLEIDIDKDSQPGDYYGSVAILGGNGKTLGVVDVVNVTQ